MKFAIEVRPHSNKSEVVRLSSGDFKVFVKSPAKEGKANVEAIKLLSDYFQIPNSGVKILHGARGRKKLVEIER